MNKKDFFKDKYKKIHQIIFKLDKITKTISGNPSYDFCDKEMYNLRELSNNLVLQINELNAGKNIFLDNNKDKQEIIKEK